MPNKYLKLAIFISYFWCISQSYFFMASPIAVYDVYVEAGYVSLNSIFEQFLLFIFIISIPVMMIMDFNLSVHNLNDFIWFVIPLILLLLTYPIAFGFWWKKQTILRAWLLAWIGMIAGPGLFFCGYTLIHGDIRRPAAIIGMNLFYLLLYVGNYIQKRYWPDNRLLNKIHSIFQWPCLRV